MTSALALRPARGADVPALGAIRRNAILELAAPTYGRERARDWADSSADERVERAIASHDVWVAEQGGAPVGWVEIAEDRIEGLYVRPDLSGSGVGSALLLHAEHRIRAAGHSSVGLEASWNAEAFYLRRGYEALAERPADGGRPLAKPLTGAGRD